MSELPWHEVVVGNSEYVKWDLPGQELTGTVEDLKLEAFEETEWSEASDKHVLYVNTGKRTEKVILNLADLTKQLKAAAPRVGDRIKIDFQRVEGKKKLFGVRVAQAMALPPSGAKPAAAPAVLTAAVSYPEEPPF